MDLRNRLRSGGELVLETLVIKGEKGEVLVPEGRYARMRNVWFLPSCATLVSWMTRCGFIDIRVVDINQTSTEEQRFANNDSHCHSPHLKLVDYLID
jgi:tRNA (mo5U34)-methyltransferase